MRPRMLFRGFYVFVIHVGSNSSNVSMILAMYYLYSTNDLQQCAIALIKICCTCSTNLLLTFIKVLQIQYPYLANVELYSANVLQ